MGASRAAEQRLDEFARFLVGLSQDGVVVRDAVAVFEERPDVGDTIVRLRLGLSDPAHYHETGDRDEDAVDGIPLVDEDPDLR